MEFYKQVWFWIILAALLIAGGIIIFRDEISIEPSVKEENVAIRVDGEVITRDEFSHYVDHIAEERQMTGRELDKEEILDEAVDNAIKEVLFSRYIEEKGYELEEKEIEEIYEMEKMQMEAFMPEGEDFPEFEEAKEQIKEMMRAEKLIDEYAEGIEITEEELRDMYEEEIAYMEMQDMGEEDIPPFEEIKEDIKENLMMQRAVMLIEEKLEELKEEAEIEVLVSVDDIDLPETEGAPEGFEM